MTLKWPHMTRNGKITLLRFKERKNSVKLQNCSVQKREIHSHQNGLNKKWQNYLVMVY